jgi:hypothetical protein
MWTALDAVKRGYILVEMNERGHFFSEGDYDILGAPLSDADDQFTGCPRSRGREERSASAPKHTNDFGCQTLRAGKLTRQKRGDGISAVAPRF